MSPYDEARRVQEEHFLCDDGLTRWCRQCGQAFPCPQRRLADEVVRLYEWATYVPDAQRPMVRACRACDDSWNVNDPPHHTRCAFAPPAKGGGGD